jgi:hypothetical protein
MIAGHRCVRVWRCVPGRAAWPARSGTSQWVLRVIGLAPPGPPMVRLLETRGLKRCSFVFDKPKEEKGCKTTLIW